MDLARRLPTTPRRTLLAAWLVAMVVASGLTASPANADNAGRKWTLNYEFGYLYYTRYFFATSVPTAMQPRIQDAANVWDNEHRMLQFARTPSGQSGMDMTIDAYPFGSLLGDYVALTQTQGFDLVEYVWISFNTNYRWYTGTGSTPSGYTDTWAAALHEFGHAVELVHSTRSQDVMWPTIVNNRRSLQTHDRLMIQQMYGPR